MKYCAPILFIVAFLVACNHKTKKITTYYKNGKIKELYTLNSNSQIEGKCYWYYENGKLQEECNYKDGKKEGKYLCYYQNSSLQSIGFYKNGLADSVSCLYYENGKLQYKGQYQKGKKILNHYLYYPNGKLNIYVFYHRGDKPLTSWVYDEQAHVTESGYLFRSGLDLTTDKMLLGDSFKYDVALACPPGTSSRMYVSCVKKNEPKVWRLVADSIRQIAEETFVAKEIGNYELKWKLIKSNDGSLEVNEWRCDSFKVVPRK